MRAVSIIVAFCSICAGCSKPASDSKAAQNGTAPSAEQPANTSSLPETGHTPVETVATDNAYPEKDAVKRILHSAREMYLKSKFQAALDLVTQALEIDPQSPSALAMQHELIEAMKRFERHDRPAQSKVG